MGIFILTGPAAAGKNSISKIIAQKIKKCAVIDVDTVRQMFVKPHKAPWEGKEGKRQQLLGVKNASMLAKNFSDDKTKVIILDVITNETAKLYKKYLGNIKIFLLMPGYAIAIKRFKARRSSVSITEKEFKMLYCWERDLTVFDKKIDNSTMSLEEAANHIIDSV